MTNICLLIGPSHTARWTWHCRDGVVPGPLKSDKIIGIGGAPIWSAKLFDLACKFVDENNRFAIMVPDFRFGNSITLSYAQSEQILQDGYLGIEPRALNLSADRQMLERAKAALALWHEKFDRRATYIFWCLFGRQVHDRLAGRHISDRKYIHPVFNYNDITQYNKTMDILDLSPLLQIPMHEVRRLFIDTSSHPSQIGYVFLSKLIFDRVDALGAFYSAIECIESELLHITREMKARIGKPILVTGRSIWLDVFSTTVGKMGAAKIADAGLIIASLEPQSWMPTISEALNRLPLDNTVPVIVSAHGVDLSKELAEAFGTSAKAWSSRRVLDWESATISTIRNRGEIPKFDKPDTNAATAINCAIPLVEHHAVEQGPQGMPSYAGIIVMLQCIENIAADLSV